MLSANWPHPAGRRRLKNLQGIKKTLGKKKKKKTLDVMKQVAVLLCMSGDRQAFVGWEAAQMLLCTNATEEEPSTVSRL